MLRIEIRKWVSALMTILFVISLLIGYQHQGFALPSPDPSGGSPIVISAQDAAAADTHPSGCHICQWLHSGKTPIARPLAFGASTLLVIDAPRAPESPPLVPLFSSLHSRAPPALLA